jgi:GT2 family glycosyltransferase
MGRHGEDALRETIEAQAERIQRLERQLEARGVALEETTRELARLNAQLRSAPANAAPLVFELPPPMPWRVRARGAAIIWGGKLLPRPLKKLVKKVWDPWVPRRRRAGNRAPEEALKPIFTPDTFDVICFSIIDWSFRWQRPQQLLSQFANAGHRVFVLKTTEFLRHGTGRSFEAVGVRDNVWEVTIAPPEAIDVYAGTIDPRTAEWFPSMLDDMRRELNIVSGVSVVHVATWREVAEEARIRFGWRLVYDCMDEWNSFPGMKTPLLAAEERLVGEADLVTVSAQRLLDKWRGRNARVVLVRNATDFEHFTAPVEQRLLQDVPHPIAGYFGAVAPWFDPELLARVATALPRWSFAIIGGVFDVDVRPLSSLPNIHLLGQQPYARMPAYLHEFDVCMIPFVVDDITAATDPVKFYEYITQGKPVVSTKMPELAPYGDLLYTADGAEDFARKLEAALTEEDETLRVRRIELARANTWPARAAVMLDAIQDVHPRVSVIVVSYGNAELTRACIDSVLRNSVHPNLELIVVDNGSTDGSVEMLQAIKDPHVRVLLNQENAGFAAANNQGLRAATGAYLVLLNNDTVVPRGWLPRLLRHLDDAQIGLTVAATNFSGNESRIPVPYSTVEEMFPFAERYMHEHDRQRFDIAVAAMYCVGMRRDTYERLGPLDEEFGIGMFEDDDYSHRARLAGLRVVCTEDVFVHHVGQASFAKLPREAYELLWKRNQEHFESKWNVRWQPHRAR